MRTVTTGLAILAIFSIVAITEVKSFCIRQRTENCPLFNSYVEVRIIAERVNNTNPKYFIVQYRSFWLPALFGEKLVFLCMIFTS